MRILAFLLFLVPSVAFAAGDDGGYLSNLLQSSLSSAGREVKISGFEGALSSRATFRELTIADDEGVWLTVRGAVLDWSRSALLRGRVEVNSLTADEIIMTRAPHSQASSVPSAQAPGFSLPDLPVSISIQKIGAARVELGAALIGQDATVSLDGSLTLAGGEGAARLAVDRIDGRDGKIALSASYSNGSRQLMIDLNAEEGAQGIVAGLVGLPGAPALALTVNGVGPVDDYSARIRLAADGQDRLAGTVRLVSETPKSADGTAAGPATQRFSADLSGDIAPLFAPSYRDFFGQNIALHLEGAKLPDSTFDLPRLSLSAQAIALNGSLRIGPDGLPEMFDVAGHLGTPGGASVLLPLPGTPTRVGNATLAVKFDAAKGAGWTADVFAKGIERAGFAIGSAEISGTGAIRHDAAALGAVDGKIVFDASGLRPADPGVASALGDRLTGSAGFGWQSGGPLRLSAVSLAGDGFRAETSGTVSGLSTALGLDGTVSASVDDLARYSRLAGRTLGGSATVTARGNYQLLAGSFDAEMDVSGVNLSVGDTRIDGLLAGKSALFLSARRDKDGTLVRKFTVSATTLSAGAQGLIRPGASNLSASGSFSDLRVLGGQYKGAMQASATYAEGPAGGKIVAHVQGHDLAIGQPQLDGVLAGDSVIDLSALRNGAAFDVQSLSVTAPKLAMKAHGHVETGANDVSASLNFSDLAALGRQYRGSLTAQAHYVEAGGTGRLSLDASGSDLALGQAQADKLLRGVTKLSLAAHRTGGKIGIDSFDLSNPQLSATATGQISDALRRVTVNAKLADLALVVPGFPGAVSAKGQISETATGYDLDLAASGPAGISAKVSGAVASDFKTAKLAISGATRAELLNGVLAPNSISGPVRFDLRLDGPLKAASLAGQVSLSGGRFVAPVIGMSAENLGVAADLGGGSARIKVEGAVGGGPVSATGTVGLAAPFPADLAVALNNVGLKNPDLYSTHVSGALTVSGPLTGGARIAGRLALAKTEIRVPSTGLGGTAAIPDLRNIGARPAVMATLSNAGLDRRKAGTSAPARPFLLDIRIDAPNQIFVRGRGLDAELGGQIGLGGTTAAVVPSGGLDLLRGRLDILGKRFTLDQGSLRMEGRFIPYVLLSASTSNDGVTSRITVEGDAAEPKITFSSSPELPQEEVLAQLLFGRSLSTISPLQAAQLASAVATLAGKGGEGIVNKLRRGFGLDDLNLTTNAAGNSEVRVGKYLTDKIYSDVGVASDGSTEATINLDLSKSVKLKGGVKSDGNTSVGVFFERNY